MICLIITVFPSFESTFFLWGILRCFFQDILRSGTQYDADQQVLENILNLTKNKRDAEKTSDMKKWLVMRLKMDGYNASLSQSSWISSLGCPAGGSHQPSSYFLSPISDI